MVTTYKNPTRIARRAAQVSTAWEQIAPEAEFAGMTLAAFKTAIGESFVIRERLAQLEADQSANLARRTVADAATNNRVKLVVNSVKGSPSYGREQRPLPRHGLRHGRRQGVRTHPQRPGSSVADRARDRRQLSPPLTRQKPQPSTTAAVVSATTAVFFCPKTRAKPAAGLDAVGASHGSQA
jgi:hypothetical protein